MEDKIQITRKMFEVCVNLSTFNTEKVKLHSLKTLPQKKKTLPQLTKSEYLPGSEFSCVPEN